MKSFFDKVAGRLDKLDSRSLERQYRHLAGEMAFFEGVLDALEEGVMVADADGALKYANAAAARMMGFELESARGRRLAKIMPDWEWRSILAPGAEGWLKRTVREFEVTYPERRIIELCALPRDPLTVLILRDVTLQRRREAEQLESGRTEAVMDLAAQVAHEIGNPLNALSLNLQLLQRALRRDDFADRRDGALKDVENMQGEIKRLDGIIRSFLGALRPQKLVLKPGSVADPLKKTLTALKGRIEDRSIRVTVDLPPALPPVMIDVEQMEQVFFNLIKNALEAMKDGGEISISVSSDDRDVVVSFRDNGAGMSDETIKRLFAPYRTTKSGGTGLGLMLSQRIVRSHGGAIEVASRQGEGSSFAVRLPRMSKRVRELVDS